MTSAQLTERINKAEAKIAKKEGTIVKKQALIEKKTVAANKAADENEKRWIESDIHWLEQDIARLHKEIAETQATLEKYNKQLAGEIEKERMLATEMPEQFKDLQKALVENWDKFDKRMQAFYRKEHDELGYKQFMQKYSYAAYELMHTCDEDIHKANMKQAELMIIDLFNRVRDITGKVTDWSGIHAEQGNVFPVLAGVVIGVEGRAKVETILAGGYNIQRLHIRTLVHEI